MFSIVFIVFVELFIKMDVDDRANTEKVWEKKLAKSTVNVKAGWFQSTASMLRPWICGQDSGFDAACSAPLFLASGLGL